MANCEGCRAQLPGDTSEVQICVGCGLAHDEPCKGCRRRALHQKYCAEDLEAVVTEGGDLVAKYGPARAVIAARQNSRQDQGDPRIAFYQAVAASITDAYPGETT
jgi:hypothetical protein